MTLGDKSRSEIQLSIAGYQYPENRPDDYDSNWLRMHLQVTIPHGSWEVTDPFFLTWEVASLADWFSQLADGVSVGSEQSFIEPTLRFERGDISPSGVQLRIFFELEARPPWVHADGAPMDDLSAELFLTPSELRLAADSLRSQLSHYPIRGPHASRQPNI
jgi:hypothetical protein